MKTTYKTTGTCARFIEIELSETRIESLRFIGGCSGNAQGLSALAQGMEATDVINRTRGVICRNGTSCPDQLAKALEELTLPRAC